MYAATGILQRCLSKAFAKMHSMRVRVLLEAVDALVRGRRLILMDIARSWAGAERVRNPLKKLDRLLSNRHMHEEKSAIYGAMAKWLLRAPRPTIVVDWSDLQAHGQRFLLRAAVPVSGQTMTILEEVYEEHEKLKPHIERDFLRRLRLMIPPGAKPIIVTDAGFRRPWFRAVRALGWDFIGRVRRHEVHLHLGVGVPTITVGHLYERATNKAQRLQYAGIGLKSVLRCDLVLYKKPKLGRIRTTHRGQRCESTQSKRAEKGAKEPWLLATSLRDEEFTAKQVVSIYGKRMQIEKSFRDLKCAHYGCAFDHSLTRSCVRLGVLLLIHALAAFVSWLTGLTLDEREALAKHGGIFAPRPRRHYSLLRLGWEALRRGDPSLLIASLYETLRNWESRTNKIPVYAL